MNFHNFRRNSVLAHYDVKSSLRKTTPVEVQISSFKIRDNQVRNFYTIQVRRARIIDDPSSLSVQLRSIRCVPFTLQIADNIRENIGDNVCSTGNETTSGEIQVTDVRRSHFISNPLISDRDRIPGLGRFDFSIQM